MVDTGTRIKDLRKKAGYSQAQLCLKIGAEPNTISRWETNKIEASHSYLVKLADALNTTTDYLLGRQENSENEKLSGDDISMQRTKENSLIENDAGKLIYTFKDGDHLEFPATPVGYELFREVYAQKIKNV